MHNRARLVTGSFLTKDLGIDWRTGAAHFWDLLVDGEIANNAGNWQWVAGTGNDTAAEPRAQPDPPGAAVRPGRRLRAPLRAGAGAHRRRAVHEPWKLAARTSTTRSRSWSAREPALF